MRKPVVSCPRERYVSVSFKAIFSILCVCQASELLVLNFGLLITNHSHSWCENHLENVNVSVALATFTPSSTTWKGSHV